MDETPPTPTRPPQDESSEPDRRTGQPVDRDAAPESGPDVRDELFDVDRVIGSFLRESSLWPVLVVLLGSGGAFAAALMVLAFVDRNPFAAAALVLIFGVTVDVGHRAWTRPHYRNGALLLGLLWMMGFVFAGFAVWSGIAFSG
ncbi:MAG: hypothetical protein R3F35_14520 [Myxococcota bacterium]